MTSLLRFTTVGSVDDGKSTLIGRLVCDLHSVFDDHVQAVRRASSNGLDLAFFTDGLQAEREQGITIDVAYRHFGTAKRRFILADTPGHEQYTRNMLTGASTADVAVILVDVANGVQTQTRRHAYLSWLLGIRRLCVVVNKMDKVDFRCEAFDAIRRDVQYLGGVLEGSHLTFIPVSALKGDNVVSPSERMPWYSGPTLLEFLETVSVDKDLSTAALRFPVQYVIRGPGSERIYAGRLASGSVKPGDDVMLFPAERRARIRSLISQDSGVEPSVAPMSVALTFTDHVDLSRGCLVADSARPPLVTSYFAAVLFWMASSPLELRKRYILKHTTQELSAEIVEVHSVLDLNSLQYKKAEGLSGNDIGQVRIVVQKPIFCDLYEVNRTTGSFILIEMGSAETLAAGMITSVSSAKATDVLRATASRVRGGVVWLTGLPSAGKTTLAQRVVERLRASGLQAELLDGDAVRLQLGKDLGFSREDREENIRRIGFVAGLLARNGVMVVVAAISPYRPAREDVRRGVRDFVEVYVNAPVEVCEQRDVKGLYGKARRGQLKQFTGVDDPYEPPLNPEVECRTDVETIQESANKILAYIEQELISGPA